MNNGQKLRSRWVRVAGVKFPDQILSRDEEETLEQLPPGWTTAAALSRQTGVPKATILRKLNAAKVKKVVLGSTRSGSCAWEPEGVKRVLNKLPKPVSKMPKGYCLMEQALKLLGISKGRFLSMATEGKFVGKKVVLNDVITHIWEIDSIRSVLMERASRGIYGKQAQHLKCPHCAEAGTLTEVTLCELVAPVKSVYLNEDTYVYSPRYSHQVERPLPNGEVYLECSNCGKRWQDLEEFMKESVEAFGNPLDPTAPTECN